MLFLMSARYIYNYNIYLTEIYVQYILRHNAPTFKFELAIPLIPFSYHNVSKNINFKSERFREVLPPRPPFRTQKYKGFPKFIKENIFRPTLNFLYCKTICRLKSDQQVWLLWSRRFFRHQDRPYWLMSYFNVICVIRHNMTFYDPILAKKLF